MFFVCAFCGDIATALVTSVMQPSGRYYACADCARKGWFLILREFGVGIFSKEPGDSC